MQYLSEGDVDMNPQTQHSLIVEEIPHELRSDKALYQYFDSLYPGRLCLFSTLLITPILRHDFSSHYLFLCSVLGKVHSASIVLNIPDLEKVAAKRKRAVRRLEKR
jgi:hypothetical protein